jgi:hypothetical protein
MISRTAYHMLPDEKAVGNMWAFFLVRTVMNIYTFIDNHKVDVQGT